MRRAPNLVSWWAGTALGAASSRPLRTPQNVQGRNKSFPLGEQIVPPLDLQSLTKDPFRISSPPGEMGDGRDAVGSRDFDRHMHSSTCVPVKVQPRSKSGSAALAPNKNTEL